LKTLAKWKKSLRKTYQRVQCRLFRGEKILVLSDSHGGVFEYIHDHFLLTPHLINCEIVGGATAYGLSKENSTTKSFSKFTSALKRFSDYNTIIVLLGEVDCSFVLWNKAIQKGGGVEEQIIDALRGYRKLLEYLQREKGKRVFIAGAPLPTIKDHQRELQELELRRQVKATQRERTELVLKLNKRLETLALEFSFGYFDITQETYDFSSGTIKEEFLIKDRIDHHQSQEATAPFWREKILLNCIEK